MDNVFVSVIVPIYNVADYLSECLDSLERQTLKNIEIIMVNDGATDGSDIIAKSYSERNANFRLVNRKNGGLSAARNTGLENAGGEYVYFLDSDDFISDDAIEKLYSKAKADNLDQLRFVAYTFEDGTKNYRWKQNAWDDGYRYLGDYPDVYDGLEFYKRALRNGDYYPSCCMIFTKRSVIESNELRFFVGILHEDNLFNFQLTTLCDRVAVLNEPLYYRRFRAESITQSSDWLKKIRAMCVSAEETDLFIEAHPQIKGEVANWQMVFYINRMLLQWEKLSVKDQNSPESREYFDRAKSFFAKYGGGKSVKLFFTSRFLYKIFACVRNAVEKANDV